MNIDTSTLIRSLCFRLWMLAIGLNTLLFALLFVEEAGFLLVPGAILVFVTSFMLSLPAFAALRLLLPVLVHNNLHYRAIFYIMMATCALLGLAVFWIFLLMAGGFLTSNELRLAILPAIAGSGAMALQYRRLRETCRERDFLNNEVRYLGAHPANE